MTLTPHPANDAVREALHGLRADVRYEDAHGIDFYLGDLPGTARPHRGQLRISYFLDLDDPDQVAADRFCAANPAPAHTRLEFLGPEDEAALRLLVELPFDANYEIWATAEAARALHFAWRNGIAEEVGLRRTLGAAGIALPPGTAGRAIHTYGSWSWGSRYMPPIQMYLFELEVVASQLIERGGFFALSHAGHGLSSYGLNLVTTQGPAAAFVQHAYGGVYRDPVRALVDINATYSRLHVLLEALTESGSATDPATDTATDNVEPRWLIAYSAFRGVTALFDLDAVRQGSTLEDAGETFDSESLLFEAVVERLELVDSDFSTEGSVSW